MAMKYQLCPTCKGEGTIVNPAVSVWTEEDRLNDPDGFETMMSGGYDIACPECIGLRVVTSAQRNDYRERLNDLRTMRMEAGIWGEQ